MWSKIYQQTNLFYVNIIQAKSYTKGSKTKPSIDSMQMPCKGTSGESVIAYIEIFEVTTSGIMIGVMLSLIGSKRTHAATTSPTAALTRSPFSSFQN